MSGYNGWKNYETWAYALWMDNDQGSYHRAREFAKEAVSEAAADNGVLDGIWTADQAARHNLSEWLKDDAEEAMPELDGVWADLLRAAFSEIDWYEIAENLITEVKD